MESVGGRTGPVDQAGVVAPLERPLAGILGDPATTFRLRFVAEKDLISGGIKWFEGKGVGPSHVDIVMPDGTYLGARNKGGVAVRPVDYIKPDDIVWERRYAIPMDPVPLTTMYAFANAQVGKGYDYSDIFSIALHANWNNPDKWICSELALATSYAGDLFLLNVQAEFTHRIDPGRLHLSPLLRGRCYYSFVKGTQTQTAGLVSPAV